MVQDFAESVGEGFWVLRFQLVGKIWEDSTVCGFLWEISPNAAIEIVQQFWSNPKLMRIWIMWSFLNIRVRCYNPCWCCHWKLGLTDWVVFFCSCESKGTPPHSTQQIACLLKGFNHHCHLTRLNIIKSWSHWSHLSFAWRIQTDAVIIQSSVWSWNF